MDTKKQGYNEKGGKNAKEVFKTVPQDGGGIDLCPKIRNHQDGEGVRHPTQDNGTLGHGLQQGSPLLRRRLHLHRAAARGGKKDHKKAEGDD